MRLYKKTKKIKKRHGDHMVEDEIHEKQGTDIIREKTRKVYHILASLQDYPKIYKTLQKAKQRKN